VDDDLNPSRCNPSGFLHGGFAGGHDFRNARCPGG
jgi:hypothetical protein